MGGRFLWRLCCWWRQPCWCCTSSSSAGLQLREAVPLNWVVRVGVSQSIRPSNLTSVSARCKIVSRPNVYPGTVVCCTDFVVLYVFVSLSSPLEFGFYRIL